LLAGQGVPVAVASRSLARASEACARIAAAVPAARLEPLEGVGAGSVGPALSAALSAADLIVAAGAAGVTLLDDRTRRLAAKARVLVDLNAVPPAGIEGIAAADKAREWDGAIVYGPLGVGGTKMKIHRAAVQRLFTSNDACLDAEDLLAIGAAM
jgi:hypothetical protein